MEILIRITKTAWVSNGENDVNFSVDIISGFAPKYAINGVEVSADDFKSIRSLFGSGSIIVEVLK